MELHTEKPGAGRSRWLTSGRGLLRACIAADKENVAGTRLDKIAIGSGRCLLRRR
ncbi:MAG: hypothetical protein QOH65_2244, partial [Methylobacteriaceae bacterium]|nr:hypothetical protein [Methylobacteriaceae bacterium]